jgi:hypothetical protein
MGYMKDLATQIEEALRSGDYMLAYELLEPFQDQAPLQTHKHKATNRKAGTNAIPLSM